MTKKEGDRKICPDCHAEGIPIEIVCKKITFQGEERLSWRNPDGSAHFDPVVDEKTQHVTFLHTPPVKTVEEIWKQEIEGRILRIEQKLGVNLIE